MLMNILPYIVNAVLSALLVIVTYKINKALKAKDSAIDEEKTRSKAIAKGVESLLKTTIIAEYKRYQEQGFCPVYAKENIKTEYEAYHNLGGNGVITELYNRLLKMPTEVVE